MSFRAFATQMLAPSKAIPMGSVPDRKSPQIRSVAGRELGHLVGAVVRHPDVGPVESNAHRIGTGRERAKVCPIARSQLRHVVAAGVCHPDVGAVERHSPGKVADREVSAFDRFSPLEERHLQTIHASPGRARRSRRSRGSRWTGRPSAPQRPAARSRRPDPGGRWDLSSPGARWRQPDQPRRSVPSDPVRRSRLRVPAGPSRRPVPVHLADPADLACPAVLAVRPTRWPR